MLEGIVKNQIIFYAMGIMLILGAAAKLVCAFSIRRMVKAASQIQKSNHKLMKLVKAKFEHASMVSDKVQNVEAFVDKYIYEYKICGISLNGFRSFPKKALWITVILGVFALFESYRTDGLGELFAGYVQWTAIFVLLLLLLSFVSDENMRIAAAKNYMVEYLENVCAHRYAKASREAEKMLEETQGTADEVQNQAEEDKEEQISQLQDAITAAEEDAQEEKRKSEQEMRIRAILEEFLA